jgi:hypothetical protein
MIDDEFEVCFELLLSVMLAKRAGAGYLPVPYPGAQKKNDNEFISFPLSHFQILIHYLYFSPGRAVFVPAYIVG